MGTNHIMSKRIKKDILTKMDIILKNVSSPLGETSLELTPNNIFDIPAEWEDGAGAFYKCMVNPFSDISTAKELTLAAKINIDDTGADKKKGKKDDKVQELSEEEMQKLKDFNAQEEAIWDTLTPEEQR